ncbi:hypothetical protein B0H14DRAFT_3522230 [Mycena olivaceomarginata]|nr:hypothetical protein B0H14DRAFT_3522230 [Mycena olivaceomarginata]
MPRFGVLCLSLRHLFLSSLFSLLILFLFDPFFHLSRMCESLYLFESVINSCWFLCTSVILFLNKIDVFERKYCLSAFIVPEGDNINITGTWCSVCSGDVNGDECCGIQHAVLTPHPTCARSVSS